MRATEKINDLDPEGKLIAPVTYSNLESFIGNIGKKRADGTCKTGSCIQGYASALKWYYGLKKFKMQDDYAALSSDFYKGHKRKVAALRQSEIMKQSEGKGSFYV
jgi:hypothetical protein